MSAKQKKPIKPRRVPTDGSHVPDLDEVGREMAKYDVLASLDSYRDDCGRFESPEARYALMDAICQRMGEGESLASICRQDGMPNKSTILRWAGDDPKIEQMYRTALMYRAATMADDMLDLAKEAMQPGVSSEKVQGIKLVVNTMQWTASRLLPRMYGEHQTIEHTGTVQLDDTQVEMRLANLLKKVSSIEVKAKAVDVESRLLPDSNATQ